MISRRGLLSACIGKGRMPRPSNNRILRTNATRPMTMFHSPQSSQGKFYPRDNQAERPDRNARTFFSSSRWLERQATIHTRRSNDFSTFTKSAYVHPLSQIVLEHLQSRHSNWVAGMGLDTGLKLNEDGTFVLRFPSADGGNVIAEDKEGEVEGNSAADETSINNGSIWTMYEPEEKKHYLCVKKESLVGRYMLQDNKKPAWHSDAKSTPELIQDAVDGMIEKIQETGV
eukprot:CAMPEP_0201923040 /NCGR_PEP_ID=MMETSP0903-20130614/10903_1 /ASSEMBLY_ACC=CAM_ASM_000552 /TAXON_ID=420261 /ORGANISM="Thalassiosira antarctica, Strain CCMP982" /LENGTH=228 /DNA_ID=CAMNT_0048460285 /DNA_START=139 /DNA_END=825 /DNA_ORIENTATION=-